MKMQFKNAVAVQNSLPNGHVPVIVAQKIGIPIKVATQRSDNDIDVMKTRVTSCKMEWLRCKIQIQMVLPKAAQTMMVNITMALKRTTPKAVGDILKFRQQCFALSVSVNDN